MRIRSSRQKAFLITVFIAMVGVLSSFLWLSKATSDTIGPETAGLSGRPAEKQKENALDREIKEAMAQLRKAGLYNLRVLNVRGETAKANIKRLLERLLVDPVARESFAKYDRQGTEIVLARGYDVFHGRMFIDINDGLENNLRWMAR